MKAVFTILLTISVSFAQEAQDNNDIVVKFNEIKVIHSKMGDLKTNMTGAVGILGVGASLVGTGSGYSEDISDYDTNVPTAFTGVIVALVGAGLLVETNVQHSKEKDKAREIRKYMRNLEIMARNIGLGKNLAPLDSFFALESQSIECTECSDEERIDLLARIMNFVTSVEDGDEELLSFEEDIELTLEDNDTSKNRQIIKELLALYTRLKNILG